jgi:Domain of unknown function (DUF6969)
MSTAHDQSPSDPGAPHDAARLAAAPSTLLRASLEAGQALLTLAGRLAAQRRDVVQAVLAGRPCEAWRMYPWEGGVSDPATESQYFYHAHPESLPQGHFHLFHRSGRRHSHLVAVAIGVGGLPVELFTVNRWVTDDVYWPAAELEPHLQRFRVETDAFDRDVGAYLRHALGLFRVEIAALLRERDRTLADYRAAHGGSSPLEVRRLEITSTLSVDVAAQLARLQAELRRRGEA